MMKEKNKFAIRKEKDIMKAVNPRKKNDVLNHIIYTKTKILSEAIVEFLHSLHLGTIRVH